MTQEHTANFSIFSDCLCEFVASRLAQETTKQKRRRCSKTKRDTISDDKTEEPLDIAEFGEFLAEEIFESLPKEFQDLSYSALQDDTSLQAKYSTPLDSEVADQSLAALPPSVNETFNAYSIVPPESDINRLLESVLNSYVNAVITPPAEYVTSSKATECEICGRDHVPLTYHHLIPRQIHDKALKRGWAKEWQLQRVAWLCRACHSYVHQIASNEELAREWNEVDKLLNRVDVQSWAAWIGRVRWRSR